MNNCIIFPTKYKEIKNFKTVVYLIALNPIEIACELENKISSGISLDGIFIGDDSICTEDKLESDLDDVISDQMKKEYCHNYYFPFGEIDAEMNIITNSIPLLSSTLIGESCGYEKKDGSYWIAKFENLDDIGKNLVEAMKLIYTQPDIEIKLLTFIEEV